MSLPVGHIITDTRDEVAARAEEYMGKLKAPFTYFGGKSAVADVVWSRFGDPANFVEPFCGSLAVLLSRPTEPKTETVNDADGWLVNFWRAIQDDPERVADYADWPVSELDLHARGDWLFHRRGVPHWIEMLRNDPDFYDAKSAGWWVWGISSWIGTGWGPRKLPHLSEGKGINRKLPHLSEGQGISRRLPRLSGMQGINRKLPHLSEGKGINRKLALMAYFGELSGRLREVRVTCGTWTRVLGPVVTTGIGTTAVFLDPPYGEGAMEYAAGGNKTSVLQDVAAWAIEAAKHPDMRIAVCGYEGAVEFPETWEAYRWKSRGGYSSQGDGDGRVNARRETIWFSPNCLRPTPSLFDTDKPKETPACKPSPSNSA